MKALKTRMGRLEGAAGYGSLDDETRMAIRRDFARRIVRMAKSYPGSDPAEKISEARKLLEGDTHEQWEADRQRVDAFHRRPDVVHRQIQGFIELEKKRKLRQAMERIGASG